MPGLLRLDDECSVVFPPCAPSLELHQQLQCVFVRPEVLEPDQRVRIQDCHKGNVSEIETFRYYLCSDQYVCLPFGKILKYHFFLCRVSCRIGIKAGRFR